MCKCLLHLVSLVNFLTFIYYSNKALRQDDYALKLVCHGIVECIRQQIVQLENNTIPGSIHGPTTIAIFSDDGIASKASESNTKIPNYDWWNGQDPNNKCLVIVKEVPMSIKFVFYLVLNVPVWTQFAECRFQHNKKK